MASNVTLSINTNVSSLAAQRRLAESTAATSQSYERLSSGLRINRASDDAAGLAISSSLKSDSRVYNQGVRNTNDAISLLNIAGGALDALTNILQRQRELATQAANGSFSFSQRQALDKEAAALTDEFNRVIATTDFNSRKLLNGSASDLRIQMGYGTSGSISFDLGGALARVVGSGSFSRSDTFDFGATPPRTYAPLLFDYDGDGKLDMVNLERDGIIGSYTWSLAYSKGNGDGTFTTFAAPDGVAVLDNGSVAVGDLNGDGRDEMVFNAAGELYTYSWNGSSFDETYVGTSSGTSGIQTVDVNGDGRLDLLTLGTTVSTFLQQSDGSFVSETIGATGVTSSSYYTTGDFNNDGKLDIVTQSQILLGDGLGGFSASSLSSSFDGTIATGDFNNDGNLDIAGINGTTIKILSGQGNGQFQTSATLTPSAAPFDLKAADINGDGNVDLVVTETGSKLGFFFGQGNGTFAAEQTVSTWQAVSNIDIGDINNDQINDIVTIGSARYFEALTGRSTSTTTLPRLRLFTQAEARTAMDTIDAALTRVANEKGAVGATQSRMVSALRTLSGTVEGYQAANSRITDIDVAAEVATLTAKKILQESATAVLAQANQQPKLALQLLGK